MTGNNTPKRAKILIADDDDLFRELVTQNLADNGFDVFGFSDGLKLLAESELHKDAGIILLDWMMPGLTGIDVLRSLREAKNTTPVIFLTVLNDQVYEEAALLGGAVDFVEKSRSFSILLKRIEVAVAGMKGESANNAPAPERIQKGDIELLSGSKRALWKGAQVGLTLTEFHIVWRMIEDAGHDLSYRDLYDVVHGEGFVGGYGETGYRANVRALIKRIRQKFRDVDEHFEQIENYPGFGYRWRDD